jgi:hypothetical protein
MVASIGIYFLFPLIVVTPVYAHAHIDPITVDSRNDILKFPKEIDFELKAHDTQAALTEATLYLKYNNSLSFQQQHSVVTPTQGQSETFSWDDDLTQNVNLFPPAGTRISYYWIIQDADGNAHTDSIQTFEVVDNRFQWQHLSEGLYQVNWYDQQNSFGQTILNQVITNAQRIENNLGGGPEKEINLWVYGSEDDFKGSLPPDVHEWVGGIAFPAINQASIVVSDLTDTTLSRDMPHEITHLIFHQLVTIGIAPTWFDEGLAVYNQTYHEYDMDVRFKEALATHSLLELSSITTAFPADADTAYLAYAQSWQLIDYMYKMFGQYKMHVFIHTMHTSFNTFDTDMHSALGLDVAHLENQWHLYLGQPTTLSQDQQTQPQPSPTTPTTMSSTSEPLLMVLGIALVFVPLLGFGGLLIYQRRTKHKAPVQAQQQGSFSNQDAPWYPPVNSALPYGQGQVPQTPSTVEDIHAGNYTSPAAYALPTTPAIPEAAIRDALPQNISGQQPVPPYVWYPPYPPYPQQPSNTPGSQPPQE